MKAAIVNPYLDTMGGGEKYTLSFAKVLKDNGYDVFVQWNEKNILKRLEKRFNLDLNGIQVIKNVSRGDGYDICFWVSDGSIPLLKAGNNILHFQVPFKNVGGDSLFNKMKLFRINKIVCNSNFTRKVIDKEYGVSSTVIYPPVSVKEIVPKKKLKKILYVGRFSILKQNKNQDFLIKVFKKLSKKILVGWRFSLVGGVEVGVGNYINKLEKLSKGLNVNINKSPDFKVLVKEYGESRIFWSAAGFGVDDEKNPESMEHFGITLVEAMSAGCVPIVYNGGGYREIIKHKENGFLWEKESDLVKYTELVISDKSILDTVSKNAIKSAQKYSYDEFQKKVLEIC